MMNEKTDKLEKFVSENRDAFDAFEPPANMFAQITQEVEARKPKKGKIRTLFYLQRVAAAIIILLAAYGVADIALGFKNNQETNELAINEENKLGTELGEAMLYYTTQVNNKRVELEEKAEEYPEILEEIKIEFDELDAEYENLEQDLKENVSNQMVIEAMIQTAKIKLEILEELSQEMKRINEKNKSHEQIIQL